MNLMIVDDNDKMRRMMKNMFNDIFTSVVECSSGEEAIEKYAAMLPEWTLMDIRMGEIDGITAASVIIKNHPEAKIVIVTQYEDDTLKDAALNSGALFFCNKIDLLLVREFIINQSKIISNNYGDIK